MGVCYLINLAWFRALKFGGLSGPRLMAVRAQYVFLEEYSSLSTCWCCCQRCWCELTLSVSQLPKLSFAIGTNQIDRQFGESSRRTLPSCLARTAGAGCNICWTATPVRRQLQRFLAASNFRIGPTTATRFPIERGEWLLRFMNWALTHRPEFFVTFGLTKITLADRPLMETNYSSI